MGMFGHEMCWNVDYLQTWKRFDDIGIKCFDDIHITIYAIMDIGFEGGHVEYKKSIQNHII